MLHNHYQQPGGEDGVFRSEGELLEEHGHPVVRYAAHNDRISKMGRRELAGATLWNGEVYKELRALIRRERPTVAHFHNTFPLISPAAYYAARAERVPVVQTLHNFRLSCPKGTFFREGKVCEDCSTKMVAWPAVVHSCYRESRSSSGAVATMLAAHRLAGTWTRMVDAYVALTEFARCKLARGGVPEEKIIVKPNFVHEDPGVGDGEGGYALFVGRLASEKGVGTMLEAWRSLAGRIPLKIVGDGPLEPEVARVAEQADGVRWLGRRSGAEVRSLMKGARVLVFPSLWYEGFPMVIAEAYAVGLPVVASDLGSMSSLIDDGRTGLHFRPGDPKHLADRVAWAFGHPAEVNRMRKNARAEFEEKYGAERNYRLLMEIYRVASERASAR